MAISRFIHKDHPLFHFDRTCDECLREAGGQAGAIGRSTFEYPPIGSEAGKMIYAHIGHAQSGGAQTTEAQAKMNREGPSAHEKSEVKKILQWIEDELHKATHSYGPFNSSHEGYAVIKEEVDEMWDDIKTNKFASSKLEAIQVAAMCVRYILDVRTE